MSYESTLAKERAAASWIERCGRFGYAAKATIHIVIGILALGATLGIGTQSPNPHNALETIFFQPFGGFLLTIVTVGLFGYAVWQLVAALVDGECDGSDAKGILMRLGKGWGALAYTALALQSTDLLIGRVTDGEYTKEWTAEVMSYSIGRGLVAMTGASIVIFGLYQFYQAYAPKVHRDLDLRFLSYRTVTLARWIGRLGFAARGVVFVLVGTFLTRAAIRYNPSDAVGLGEAFLTLKQQPFGPWLLGAVAAGFIAYGVYELFKGYYRHLDATTHP
jgi:hypothetical protein